LLLFRGFSHRDFRFLWFAQTISRVGDGIHTVALAWLVLELTGSAAALGLVLAAELIPKVALMLLGGALVDRLPKLPLMVGSDAIRAVVVAVIGLRVASGDVQVVHLVALGVIFGIVDAVFSPAYSAVVPELVPLADRPSANALSQLGRRLAGIAGPAIGAVLVAAGGTAAAFGIDALTFVLSALVLVVPLIARRRIEHAARSETHDQPEPRAAPRTSILDDVREGFRTVLALRWIALTIAIAGITNITLVGPLDAAAPLLVKRNFGGDVAVLGMIGSLIALGSVAGAVLLGSRLRLRHRGGLIYGPWVANALAIAAMGLPIGLVGLAIAAFVIGLTETTLGLAWTSAVQDHVPDDRLGRVYSVDALGSYALIPIGLVVAGAASDAIGPGPVFVAGGLISAVLLVLVWALPPVRNLD
jgi:DHA3 family tetracycline resistance protein-like MFS transporter